ncbi:MAG TPA: type II CAAX endopeptidase family protein [Flavobacterium sp.]|uniref:type II CAAX endopeptidase family protein n=1 Tax=Flavobacterium sp. TaxID=239 RepID=UPI002F406F4E
MDEKKSTISKIWNKAPLIIRSIILGFTISTIGVLTWSVLATFVPLPWSFILMMAFLWFYIKYLSGSWNPKHTKLFRKQNFRNPKLSLNAWFLSIVGITLIVLIEQSGLIVTFRLMEFPAERFSREYSFLENVPAWAAWLVVIMISAVAGICEEIGFRGYMQVPLEKKYGPLMAISIGSIIFVIVHLHQAWSGPIIFQIFFISVLFGSIAYYSNSLIPGIIAHFIMDICNFSFWWSKLGHQFDKKTILETGIDYHFIIWNGTFLISIGLFIYVMSRLKSIKNNIRLDIKTPANNV